METAPKHAIVGLGVIVVDANGKVLIIKRKGVVPKYALPGGHLEPGETFGEGAMREIREETGLDIKSPRVIAVTNNLETYQEIGKHYISIILLAKKFSGEAKVMEPEKCERLLWCNPQEVPEPLFDGSRFGIRCWLEGKFYVQ